MNLYSYLTEEQIERRVERQMNRLDAQLMAGNLTQSTYDLEVMTLDKWAEAQHHNRRAYEPRARDLRFQ